MPLASMQRVFPEHTLCSQPWAGPRRYYRQDLRSLCPLGLTAWWEVDVS